MTGQAALEQTKAFLNDILAAETSRFPSVGYGTDVRFQSTHLAGTALVHNDEVIHAAFFRLDTQEQPGKMASLRNRRRHYRE